MAMRYNSTPEALSLRKAVDFHKKKDKPALAFNGAITHCWVSYSMETMRKTAAADVQLLGGNLEQLQEQLTALLATGRLLC